MTDTAAPGTYVPGVCNIGPAEIARRRDLGLAGAGIAAVVLAAAVLTGAPKPLRALVVPPAAAAASGLLQARLHFCSGFGMRGVFNMGATGHQDTVEEAAFRRADRRRAVAILSGAAGAGAGVGALAMLLP